VRDLFEAGDLLMIYLSPDKNLADFSSKALTATRALPSWATSANDYKEPTRYSPRGGVRMLSPSASLLLLSARTKEAVNTFAADSQALVVFTSAREVSTPKPLLLWTPVYIPGLPAGSPKVPKGHAVTVGTQRPGTTAVAPYGEMTVIIGSFIRTATE
jgi:hypothetical protein